MIFDVNTDEMRQKSLLISHENNYKNIDCVAFAFAYGYNEIVKGAINNMKKYVILDIFSNIFCTLLMAFPLSCFGIGPILLLVSNIYFDTKHKNKFVLWRLIVVYISLTLGSIEGILVFKYQNDFLDNETVIVATAAFWVYFIAASIVFLIYQVLVLIAVRNSDS